MNTNLNNKPLLCPNCQSQGRSAHLVADEVNQNKSGSIFSETYLPAFIKKPKAPVHEIDDLYFYAWSLFMFALPLFFIYITYDYFIALCGTILLLGFSLLSIGIIVYDQKNTQEKKKRDEQYDAEYTVYQKQLICYQTMMYCHTCHHLYDKKGHFEFASDKGFHQLMYGSYHH